MREWNLCMIGDWKRVVLSPVDASGPATVTASMDEVVDSAWGVYRLRCGMKDETKEFPAKHERDSPLSINNRKRVQFRIAVFCRIPTNRFFCIYVIAANERMMHGGRPRRPAPLLRSEKRVCARTRWSWQAGRRPSSASGLRTSFTPTFDASF